MSQYYLKTCESQCKKVTVKGHRGRDRMVVGFTLSTY